ncbi:helix-turn-helix transcriptional regulator [Streptomyces sp. NBC_00878]|uniref:helix-turn-helix domain-containing protein n=1 Tax=Streptomyces sp. NBC_00878 TaxID=2975854 RepID=UPI00225167E8|nr:helix-turn-helix transcriptional regulator [Streptomyces sp. NBC_00878]MCX4910162.1 helix-turn-helix transcriptional regulator [Streptomyces sp. NBC_00878]
MNPLRSFGLDVREVRTSHGMSQKGLGHSTGYSESYVSKVEKGAVVPSEKFARGCDLAFNTGNLFTRQLMRLLKGDHPSWFVPYLQLERRASQILDYSNAFVMGMLQTPAYAGAVFRATHPRESSDVIKGRIEARTRRRDVMERDAPPLLWVILHEAVLRAVVGGPEVMQAQLEHLLVDTESPHVTVQVLPFKAGAPAASLPFNVLSQNDGQSVMYSESRGQGHVTDSAAAVAEAQATYDRLRAAALSPEDSVALIREAMEAYTS